MGESSLLAYPQATLSLLEEAGHSDRPEVTESPGPNAGG